MKERLRIFSSLAIFWLTFMVTGRIIFLLYNHDFARQLDFPDIILSVLHGFRMDASIVGYFLALYGLLLTISVSRNGRWVPVTFTFITVSLLIFCALVTSVDLELYRHWGFRMNTTPLLYIGSEAMGSIALWVYIKIMFLFLLLLFIPLQFYRIRILPRLWALEEPSNRRRAGLIMLLTSVLMFIPIRGSFTVAPMNTGFVYFHNTKPFANHTAINVIWNFLYSVRKSASADYPTNFFPPEKTEKLFSDLNRCAGNSPSVLSSKEPNIILVILESFTADVIGPLGGIDNICPNLNALCDEGILFTNFYASGDRTDKGIISILSGYPAQPQTSIIKLPAKTQHLPQLNQHLKALGYRTSFLYGGDIDFANFRSYLNTSGFDHLTTLDDFPSELYTSKWGVHDHHMFNHAMQELDTTSGKFFKVILTLSSHEPFDVPMKAFIAGQDEESLFLNSCHYTDQALGKFVAYCKTKDWWNNTIMVITADHGHRYPRNKALIQKERFHIPLLIIGGAIQQKAKISTIGSQTDIANTLLGQLSKRSQEFTFSKDLLNSNCKPFAAYFFTDGYGFVIPGKFIVYDNPGRQFLKKEGATEEDLDLSKAYQQKLFTDYNNLDK